LGWAVPIYVADTDERAREEAKAPIESLFNEYLNNPWEMLLPPGYTSLGSTKRMMKARAALGTRPKHQSVDSLIESGTALIGSPQTVREKIEKMREFTGFRNLIAMLQFGVMTDTLAKRNMEMFASEVMPRLRD
jgi:alkanesulfonate monooxygenase SsuD/methylene tetrahydromethanopterin reductase-like flavin-dependent oxidoreductase (luciferase family)